VSASSRDGKWVESSSKDQLRRGFNPLNLTTPLVVVLCFGFGFLDPIS